VKACAYAISVFIDGFGEFASKFGKRIEVIEFSNFSSDRARACFVEMKWSLYYRPRVVCV